MNHTYLLTGGNLGHRMENLQAAATLIQQQVGKLTAQSSVYETAAWGKVVQPDYLNQVLAVETSYSATGLLPILLQIEKQLGRVRQEKYGSRIIDIDILFFNEEVIHLPDLIIPHPQLQNRRFVLTPLFEIAPAYVHPVLKQTVAELLNACSDPLNVKKFYPL
jgi:2-amino-4-hydroxy-6-hydroxymethyldihydropteridine diphosphokinase